MRQNLARLAALLVLAAGSACWSGIKEEEATTPDSGVAAPGTGPGTTEGGVAQPASSQGGPLPAATDTLGAAGRNDPQGSGPGRAAQAGGTNAGARDTTRGARPPR